MAVTVINDPVADELGTYIIKVSFTDEDGSALTPKTLKWSLCEGNTIVNNREDVTISSPSSTEHIVLSGADLSVSGSSEYVWLRLKIEGTYDSTYGNDLPVAKSVRFKTYKS